MTAPFPISACINRLTKKKKRRSPLALRPAVSVTVFPMDGGVYGYHVQMRRFCLITARVEGYLQPIDAQNTRVTGRTHGYNTLVAVLPAVISSLPLMFVTALITSPVWCFYLAVAIERYMSQFVDDLPMVTASTYTWAHIAVSPSVATLLLWAVWIGVAWVTAYRMPGNITRLIEKTLHDPIPDLPDVKRLQTEAEITDGEIAIEQLLQVSAKSNNVEYKSSGG